LWLVKNAQLSQHSPAIVVDSFSGKAILGVEGVHATKRKVNSSPSCWKTTPGAEMRAVDYDLKHDCVLGNVPALDFDVEIRQCFHELFVKLADSAGSLVMLAPGFVIVVGGVAEGGKNAVEVMRVLQSNVLFDNRDASCPLVSICFACWN
jgi:hypothetical protein